MIEKTPKLVFDADSGTYTLGGFFIPGVGELVSILGDEPPAPQAAAMRDYIARRLGGARAERGQDCAGYAVAVDRFLGDCALAPRMVYQPLRGRERGERFAGTPDFIGLFDGELAVLSFDFAPLLEKSKAGARLGAYQTLAFCNGMFPERLYAVLFLPDGKYHVYPAGSKADGFGLCIEVYRERTKTHPRGKIL